MTGQGNKEFERIKRTHYRGHIIDVFKTYRTTAGHRVRGLHEERTNKTVVRGAATESSQFIKLIKGQVWMKCELTSTMEWMERAWDENGNDLLNEDFNLVEYKETPPVQPKLFAGL